MGNLRFVAVELRFPRAAAARWRKLEVARLEAAGAATTGKGSSIRISGVFEEVSWLGLEEPLLAAIASAAQSGARGHGYVGEASGEVLALSIADPAVLAPVPAGSEAAAWAVLEQPVPAPARPAPVHAASRAAGARRVTDLDAAVVTLHCGPSGRIWAGLSGGLAVSEDGGERWRRISGAGNGVVRTILEEPDGSVWIAGFRTPLRRSRDGKKFEAASAVRTGERTVLLKLGDVVLSAGSAPVPLLRLAGAEPLPVELSGTVLAGAAWGGGAVLFGTRGAAWHWNGSDLVRLNTGARGDFLGASAHPAAGVWAVTDKAVVHARDGLHFSTVPFAGPSPWCVEASADRIVIGTDDGVWSSRAGAEFERLCKWPSAVRCVCLLRDGSVLLGTQRGEIVRAG